MPPNLVLILADDLRHCGTSGHGTTFSETARRALPTAEPPRFA